MLGLSSRSEQKKQLICFLTRFFTDIIELSKSPDFYPGNAMNTHNLILEMEEMHLTYISSFSH